MANSTYSYIRSYEQPDSLLPNTYLLIRLDGHKFHQFSSSQNFEKPNDERALRLMNRAGRGVMEAKGMGDVVMGFGESDEFSFLIRRQSTMHNRRASKILTLITSLFTSHYIYHYPTYFPPSSANPPLDPDQLPTFDGRIVCYPGEKEVKDYFRWRQVDTHVNNLYNTTFWALIQQGGMSPKQATKALEGTFSKDKHEILYSRFRINYNGLPEIFRKGSILLREEVVDLGVDGVQEEERGKREGGGREMAEEVRGEGVEVRNGITRKGKEKAVSSSEVTAGTESRGNRQGSVLAGGGGDGDGDEGDEELASAVSHIVLPPDLTSPAPLQPTLSASQSNERKSKGKPKNKIPKAYDGTTGKVIVLHEDLIKDEWWERRRWLLD